MNEGRKANTKCLYMKYDFIITFTMLRSFFAVVEKAGKRGTKSMKSEVAFNVLVASGYFRTIAESRFDFETN